MTDEAPEVDGSEPETSDGLEPPAEESATADGLGPDADKTESAQDKKLAREAAKWRKRTRDLEAQLKARDDAELSEQEKAQRRMVELEAQVEATEAKLREAQLRQSVMSAATRLNVVDADAAFRLLDTDGLYFNEADGKWEGVEEAVAALIEEKSYLVGKQAAVSATSANPAKRRTRLTREALAEMTQAEIDALPFEDIEAALSSTD